MMFGNVDALRRGEKDMAFAEHYTLERFTKDRVKVDIENPLYVPTVIKQVKRFILTLTK